jgi:hypothetical protein
MALEANSDWQRQSIKGKSLLTSFRFRSLTRMLILLMGVDLVGHESSCLTSLIDL